MEQILSKKCWYNVLVEELDGAELTKKEKTKINGEENG